MLSVALKSLPVGTAYAVWVGIGVLGVAMTGMIALGESVSVLRLTFLALILAGIIGLKIGGSMMRAASILHFRRSIFGGHSPAPCEGW